MIDYLPPHSSIKTRGSKGFSISINDLTTGSMSRRQGLLLLMLTFCFHNGFYVIVARKESEEVSVLKKRSSIFNIVNPQLTYLMNKHGKTFYSKSRYGNKINKRVQSNPYRCQLLFMLWNKGSINFSILKVLIYSRC